VTPTPKADADAGVRCDADPVVSVDADGQSNWSGGDPTLVGAAIIALLRLGLCWLLLHDKENVTTQRGQNKYVEVNKRRRLHRILELDIQKWKNATTPHMACKIHVGWGAGILLAVYVVLTSQYLYGNAVLVRGDNYVLPAEPFLFSIGLCYGLMWIGVIRSIRNSKL